MGIEVVLAVGLIVAMMWCSPDRTCACSVPFCEHLKV